MGASPQERAIRIAMILTTLLLVAWLTASGATQMLAAAYFPVEPASGGPKGPAKRPAPTSAAFPDPPSAVARRVLTRNMFDSETGPLTWDPPVTEIAEMTTDETAEPMVLNGEPEPCPGSARLVASMVVPNKPHLSFASIEEGGQAMLYRSGMQVGDAKLVGIREQRVFLQPASQPLCQLVMFRPPDAAGPKPTPEPKSPRPAMNRPKRKGALSDEDLDQGITKNSDTTYTITRELVDKILGNQAELMRSARIIPYEENGRTVGVKVYGIRRNSVLGRLGMQNGDVLRTINGHDMTSPDSALEAYTRLREASNLSLSMLRRGQPTNLEYTIR